MKKTIIALITIATIICCGGIINPPSGPGTEYPCGVQGKVCPNSMCCWRGDDCGGAIGCPVGYCCFNGDDTAFGYTQPYKQASKDEAKTRMSKPR